MNDSTADVQQTLEYRADTALARLLPSGLFLLFLGILMLAMEDKPNAKDVLVTGILLIAGFGLTAFALWRRWNSGGPMFVLSPAGVHYRIAGVKNFLIPWREIRSVDTIDVTSWDWSIKNPGTITFHGVTALTVSKEFYQTYIHVRSLFLRGPSWGNVFIAKAPHMQVALHPYLVSTDPRALRDAVVARWQAFRNQPVASGSSVPATRRPPMPHGTVMGESPRTMPWWDTALTVVFLIGIAVALSNFLGLWSTKGQIEERAERAHWAEQRKKWHEDARKLREQQEEMDRRIKEQLRRL